MNSMRKYDRPDTWDTTRITAIRPAAPRKLRVLVAGEFSAGKTRLINGLIGEKVLPSNVTATAVPPVWLVRGGDRARFWVDHDDVARPIEDLAELALEDVHYCLISHPAPILDRIDIIDTPGTSDPNMPVEGWQRMLGFADLVIWCTNATQAWRQSEKAVWDEMPAALRESPLLVVTHADRLTDENTRMRMMRRVHREAGEIFPSTLLAALNDEDDIARIAAKIDELTSRIASRPGKANPVAEKFAAERSVIAFPKTRTPVRPRRILSARLVKAAGEGATDEEFPAQPEPNFAFESGADPYQPEPAAAEADSASTGLSGFEMPVLELRNPELQASEAELPELDLEAGWAGLSMALEQADAPEAAAVDPRLLWAELAQGADLSSAASVLARVELLLEELEAQHSQPRAEADVMRTHP